MSIREEHQGSLEPVLRAAAAPAHPAELAGEQEAVAAFLTAAPAPRRRSFLARVLTVKAMVIAGVAASTTVVLATASGVLPAPWPQQPSVPPADDPPAVITTTTSQPAMTPPAGHPPVESEPADEDQVQPGAPATGQPPQDDRPCGHCDEDRRDRSHDEPDDDKPGKGDKQGPNSTPPSPAVPSSGTRSPGSSASGAVTAVPPSGAAPPTKGG